MIMSGNLHNRGPRDRRRINLEQGHEIQYWTRALGCSAEELEQAIGKVGSSAGAVKRMLKGRHKRAGAH